MRCPHCGAAGARLVTARSTSDEPARRFSTTCSDCGRRWDHPFRDGYGTP